MREIANNPKIAFGTINESGRLMIPVALRKELGIKPGERLFMEVEDGVLRVQTHRSVIHKIQEEFRKYAPMPGEMLISDQLIAERREEARREEEETDRQLEEYRLRNERQLV